MFLEGPGGTGKTHVLKALQNLMCIFGCAHRIHFLAPTGGAAALVDGQTIHKGLGLSVHHCNQNKSEQKDKDLAYHLTTKKQEELRLEWHDIDFVAIDEVSMASVQLLAELDASLWYAHEEYCDDWFGGINIIFSGDFYQHPPVLACPLYVPIRIRARSVPHQEALAHFGCLAWKQVNMVLQFTEQKQMEGDPEYAHAILNLCQGICDKVDLGLLNS